MNNKYFDLIDQTFYFPQEGFDLTKSGWLSFNGVPLKYLIENYGTPLKLTYLPKISSQVKRAKNFFKRAIKAQSYTGNYYYCYCTKSNHFKYVLDEVLRQDVHIETSSAFDIDLIHRLHKNGQIDKNRFLIHNGFKTNNYLDGVINLINDGFNSIPICDNKDELEQYAQRIEKKFKIGLRIATEEEPNFEFYTSRLGIRSSEIVEFCKDKVTKMDNVELKMLHFFVDTGIKDTLYYWGELKKAVKIYCELKKVCPELDSINIGGGMPIRNSLGFEYDYRYMVGEIVKMIKYACEEEDIDDPHIFTEFGKYTVGESGAVIFSVIGQKQQNDRELWYMLDNSLMSTLPDCWGMSERFILLPINKWYNPYTRVNLGGLSCDNADYYNSEVHENSIYLPVSKDSKPLYLGFFHTGAYQDALSGYGGIKHCLIPSPKHILIDHDESGALTYKVIKEEQRVESMLEILGY